MSTWRTLFAFLFVPLAHFILMEIVSSSPMNTTFADTNEMTPAPVDKKIEERVQIGKYFKKGYNYLKSREKNPLPLIDWCDDKFETQCKSQCGKRESYCRDSYCKCHEKRSSGKRKKRRHRRAQDDISAGRRNGPGSFEVPAPVDEQPVNRLTAQDDAPPAYEECPEKALNEEYVTDFGCENRGDETCTQSCNANSARNCYRGECRHEHGRYGRHGPYRRCYCIPITRRPADIESDYERNSGANYASDRPPQYERGFITVPQAQLLGALFNDECPTKAKLALLIDDNVDQAPTDVDVDAHKVCQSNRLNPFDELKRCKDLCNLGFPRFECFDGRCESRQSRGEVVVHQCVCRLLDTEAAVRQRASASDTNWWE